MEAVTFFGCPNCEKRLFKFVRRIPRFIIVKCANCGKKMALHDYHSDRKTVTCPKCGKHPPLGPYWACGDPETKKGCSKSFDTFLSNAKCPYCGREFTLTTCPKCWETTPYKEWIGE